MLNFDNCLLNLKALYEKSSDSEKDAITKILYKLSDLTGTNAIEDFSLNMDGICKITKLPDRGALLCDTSSLNEDAMLIYLHMNQIGALKELYGIDLVKKIILDKAEYLNRVMSGADAVIYNIDIQRFVVLVKKSSQFDKYLSILKYSVLNNLDKDVYECEHGHSIITDFTIGIAYGQEYLLHHANIALQEAILSNTNYKVYESSPTSLDLQKLSFDRLKVYKNALHDGKIVPYFQPIIDTTNGSVMKYEALARLITEDGRVVQPHEFLNSAIEDNTFEFFTRQMTQNVFNIYSKTDVHISMNLTYDNISSKSMLEYIKNRLDKYGGDRMTFEIVETEEIKDYKIVEEFILMAKEYGAKISIDDFGSGYSNFTNIIKLNIDYIKIDGTLISKLLEDQKVKNMVSGLIQFAKSINVQTIAEFVSSREIANEVMDLGVDYVQGYHYGEPKTAKEYSIIQ